MVMGLARRKAASSPGRRGVRGSLPAWTEEGTGAGTAEPSVSMSMESIDGGRKTPKERRQALHRRELQRKAQEERSRRHLERTDGGEVRYRALWVGVVLRLGAGSTVCPCRSVSTFLWVWARGVGPPQTSCRMFLCHPCTCGVLHTCACQPIYPALSPTPLPRPSFSTADPCPTPIRPSTPSARRPSLTHLLYHPTPLPALYFIQLRPLVTSSLSFAAGIHCQPLSTAVKTLSSHTDRTNRRCHTGIWPDETAGQHRGSDARHRRRRRLRRRRTGG